MIEIIDDTLEHHNAELVDMSIRNLSWKYDYSSTDKGLNKHWHILCGHTPEECKENGYDYLLMMNGEYFFSHIGSSDSIRFSFVSLRDLR